LQPVRGSFVSRLALVCSSLTIAGFATPLQAACDPVPGLTEIRTGGWGLNERNTRLQPDTAIDAASLARLELKWVYALSTSKPRSWPLVSEDTIFIGDSGRGLIALDRVTGCERWVHEHTGEIGTAILHHRIGDRHALLFADRTGGLYAVDATTGKLIWHQVIAEAPVPLYSGTPLLHQDTLFVPVSSLEIGLSLNPLYGCCTTSGAVAALRADSGETTWYRRTIETAAKVTGRHLLLVSRHGPSGAPVWGTPTLDSVRGLLFFGTGQNYSHPTTATSDAIFAVAMDTGEVRWTRQFTEQDAYNVACDISVNHPNCPKPLGPDWDFGAPPVLVRAADTELLIAGQKSGDVHALDPDTGEVAWTHRVGRGGALGGIHWGLAAIEPRGIVLVPVSDIPAYSPDRPAQPGLYALDIATGAVRWMHARQPRCEERICSAGLSAAITATPDLVFAGSLDGYLEAYDAGTGEVLWSHDSWQDYQTVNDRPARGGAFDAHGPMVVDDLVIVSSGYDSYGQQGGNALLVFKLRAEDASP
jgi:polyvinyl alcohol dehydrogenase (cytochrome)